jgi:hypothetical protein
MPARSRILRALFVAYVVATVTHVGWVLAHEPFSYDAWNIAVDTHAKPATIGRFFDYWWFEYTHSNPRLGQPLTYLAYKLEYFAVIATPLVVLGLAVVAFVLGTARWPSWRRGRDLALVAIALGFTWFALPQIGKTMFCRAYGVNYLYGAVLQLWFLVPLRLSADGRASRAACFAYLLAGLAAGMCNEHTGPTLCAFMIGYAWWLRRTTKSRPSLAWAGALGAVAGFALIFFAPGQGQRYDGLAQRVSLVGRLLARGVTGNLEIFRDLVLAAAPLLGLVVIVAIVGAGDFVDEAGRERRRRALRTIGLVMVAGSAITATLFVSPKLGPRFFIVPMALLLAAFVGLADTVLDTPRRLAPFVTLAAAASIYAGAHTIPLYSRLAEASSARLAALDATKPGTVFTAESFEQVDDSWWFLGDELRAPNKRDMIATYYDLAGVVFRAYDPTAPLGITDVRLVAHTDRRVDDQGGLELGSYRGLDVASIHKAMLAAIVQFRARLGNVPLEQLDLAVEFMGDRPALPRPDLLVGRWRPTGFEGWAGAIVRKTRAKTRDVVLPPRIPPEVERFVHDVAGATLPKGLPPEFEIYIYQVGGEARRLGTAGDPVLQYVPWRTGMYWVLACRPTECFVIATARQAG